FRRVLFRSRGNGWTMRDDLRILILEDDDDDVELIRRCLKKEIPSVKIMRVRTRGAFESALDRRDYDLILSDSTLPGFSGSAALAMARQRGIDCPFIFVSGTLGGQRAAKEMPDEADARLSKDEIRALPSVIGAILERSAGKTPRVPGDESVRNAEERYSELLDSVHAI